MLKPFVNSVRNTATRPLTWRTLIGIIAVPMLIVGLLGWALWSPESDHGTAKAAVVNNDEPVTVNGQLAPLGRELAGKLTHNENSSYTWVLTDAEDAKAGLADGTYAASVTIPKEFSARATSAGTASPMQAQRAKLSVATSPYTGVIDPVASRRIAQATVDTLNQQVVETYLNNVYLGFTDMHGQINRAADGAGQLADGTGQLRTGSQNLATGAKQLNNAAGQVANGSAQLTDGTARLVFGAGQLADGLAQAERDTANLPALTRQLADGAQQVADGNRQLADRVVPLADRVIAAIDSQPSATASAQKVQQLTGQCRLQGGDARFCEQLSNTTGQAAADAAKIDGQRAETRRCVVEVRDAVQALATGSQQVASGNAQLAAKSQELVAGIASAANGARQLHSGSQQIDHGARQLATGNGQLAQGTGSLSTGANQLAGGVEQANAGAKGIASGLDQGRNKVPSYTDQQRDHLKTVASKPAEADTDETPVGTAAAVLAAVLAMWACALTTYILITPVPPAVLTSREPTWRIITRAALPGVAVSVLASAVVTLILVLTLGLGIGQSAALLGVVLLTACTFTAVHQSIAALFERPGRLASLAVLVFTLITGVVSTVPRLFAQIGALLPTHGALQAIRSVVYGVEGTVSGIAELAAWLWIGTLAAIVITDRRRSVSATQLRVQIPVPASGAQ